MKLTTTNHWIVAVTAALLLQCPDTAQAFSLFRSSRTTTTALGMSATAQEKATTSAVGGLNEDKFVQDLMASMPSASTAPSGSIWESAENRMLALAAKGRALQQKYAVEISELQNKRVMAEFPDRVPLSNAAIWREEADIPVSANGAEGVVVRASGSSSSTSQEEQESSGGGAAFLGLVAAASAVLVVTEPAMVTDALAQLNINVDLSSVSNLELPQVDTAAVEAQVQQLKDLTISMTSQATAGISQSLQELQLATSTLTADLATQFEQASNNLVASTMTWKDQISIQTQQALEQYDNLVASTLTWKDQISSQTQEEYNSLVASTLTLKDQISSQTLQVLEEYPSMLLGKWQEFQTTTIEPTLESVQLLSQNVNKEGSSLWSSLQESFAGSTKQIMNADSILASWKESISTATASIVKPQDSVIVGSSTTEQVLKTMLLQE